MPITVEQFDSKPIILVRYIGNVTPEEADSVRPACAKILSEINGKICIIIDGAEYTPDLPEKLTVSNEPVPILNMDDVDDFDDDMVSLAVIIPHPFFYKSMKQQINDARSKHPELTNAWNLPKTLTKPSKSSSNIYQIRKMHNDQATL